MKPLFLAGSSTTPTVTLDAEKNQFEIAGRSVDENASTFYSPVVQWIHDYAKNPNSSTVFTFKLEYCNTTSSKAILDIISALSGIGNVKILWYCEEGDEDMKETGAEVFDLVNIPFEYKTY